MIIVDEITGENKHLIQMRIEDFGVLLAQHRLSLDFAAKQLADARDRETAKGTELHRVMEAAKRDGKVNDATIGMLRAALKMLVDGVQPRTAKERGIFEQAKQTLDSTEPVPF